MNMLFSEYVAIVKHLKDNLGRMAEDQIKKEEAVVATDAKAALMYATFVLKGPFKLGEKVIASNPETALRYAVDVLKAPFAEGEAAIKSDVKVAEHYVAAFGNELSTFEYSATEEMKNIEQDVTLTWRGFWNQHMQALKDSKFL